ncbi:hypothetical protein QQP08_010285 [Theobroma cacao]|nr:hypothetical protein QQP08_010285 [Theobroma cacao]
MWMSSEKTITTTTAITMMIPMKPLPLIHLRHRPPLHHISSSAPSSSGSDDDETSNASGSESSGGEVANVNTNSYDYDNNNNSEKGIYGYEEEERDLFGSDNEDNCKIPAICPFSIPGK